MLRTVKKQRGNGQKRRQEITKLVALGLTNKEIGAQLNISERLTKWYLGEIYREHGFARACTTGNRWLLIAWAFRNKLVA